MISNSLECAAGSNSAFDGGRAVSFANRVTNVVFGSPSAVRANGGRNASLASCLSNGRAIGRPGRSAAVYQLDRVPEGKASGLPRVWISEPTYDPESGEVARREYVASYPCGNDPKGAKAYQHGLNYFSEALRYGDTSVSELRNACFRAAEVLFLHAESRGCVEASIKLGVIYESDLCAGVYYGKTFLNENDLRLYLDARAVESFSAGSELGDSEATRRLASLVAAGRGSVKDLQLAFQMYLRAFDLADAQDDCANRGYAALRIAHAYESAEGCEHSFRRAYQWYRMAEDDLAYIVDEGAWHYKKPKHLAVQGVRRMRQELLGCC